MLKKILLPAVFSLLSITVFGQTIVSTTPEDKKVILEEFTGINCQFCPDGHAIAQSIQNAHPGDVFLVNIHVGGFAVPGPGQPDFRTPWGSAIAGQSNLTGYPAGTVNRHFFPGQSQGGGTAMSRSQWNSAANQILVQPAYLNLGVEAEIDINTRELTVHVEVYYTGDSPFSTNKLNIALLQNNTLGPQAGGGMGDEYVHQHRLVHLLTGQWGVDINSTTTGSFYDNTFTYTIPNDYNNILAQLGDMEIVAFVAENTQEIISGNGAFPTFSGINNANDAFLQSIDEIIDQCENEISPVITIQNVGLNPLTALAIEYSVNGGTVETYNWTGNLTTLQSEEIELPPIAFNMQASNTLNVSLPNDDENNNNSASETFDEAPQGTGTLFLTLNTDNVGDEVRWFVRDTDENIIQWGGPYPNNSTINETIELDDAGCYRFDLIDIGGNGGTEAELVDDEGTEIFYSDGNFEDEVSGNFGSDGNLGIGDNNLEKVSLYPNPAQTILNITGFDTADIRIYNILGSEIISLNEVNNRVTIDVSTLQSGAYFVRLSNGNATQTKKFVVNR